METPRTTHTTVLASPLTRRTALRGVGALGIATGLAIAGHGHTRATEAATPAMPIEPDAGSWKTWVLSSGAELRPAAPPDDAASLRMTRRAPRSWPSCG
ncbi:MAG: hypothetical protein K0S14_3652 [Thermomicrobiales bacterium]|nr:hypothetical protein [Thermomicrobiales bacterium]